MAAKGDEESMSGGVGYLSWYRFLLVVALKDRNAAQEVGRQRGRSDRFEDV
jgi:hypothetical protein